VPHNFLNGKDHSSSVNLFLKLAQSASIEEVVEDLAEIASEKGIHLHSVMVKRGRLEREFKPPNAVAVVGRISELAAGVEGGQTRLVVRFYEPTYGAVVWELEYAAYLAAHRIEFLAGGSGGARTVEAGGEGRSMVIDELIGESDLIREVRKDILIAAGSVAKNILTTFYSGNDPVFATISCVASEFLQQSHENSHPPLIGLRIADCGIEESSDSFPDPQSAILIRSARSACIGRARHCVDDKRIRSESRPIGQGDGITAIPYPYMRLQIALGTATHL